MQNTNQKHLTLEDRNYIEQALNQDMSFKEIGKFLSKDPSTISKEIKKHKIMKEPSRFNGYGNICKKRFSCRKKNVCRDNCKGICFKCSKCNTCCPEFEEDICPSLLQPPYVCNPCKDKGRCRLVKYYYRALPSYNQYKDTLSSSRQGYNLSEEKLVKLDNIVTPLLKHGQTLAHICKTQDIGCSKSTLYNYIDKNYLSVCNLDLPRRVRYPEKISKKRTIPRDTTIRKGRTYEDFEKYIQENPDTSIVEMDTVEGIKGGKVLLTMLFRSSKLMLAFLLNDRTANSVLKVFNWLEAILGNDLFEKTFPVILTDNGSEFSNPVSLEFNSKGIGRTRIFFCNPHASYQKGAIEKNHEFIRYVIPKGTSMDNLTQQDITKMINHINSLTRPSLNNATPYDLAQILLGRDVLKKLNLKKVAANEVQLNSKLLKKN